MLRFDEGDRAFDLLTVLGPAGLLQLFGEGRQPMCAEGGARRFEGVVQPAYGVVLLSLPVAGCGWGVLTIRDTWLRSRF